MKIFEIHFGDLCGDAKIAFMEFHNAESVSDLPIGPIVSIELEEKEDGNVYTNVKKQTD